MITCQCKFLIRTVKDLSLRLTGLQRPYASRPTHPSCTPFRCFYLGRRACTHRGGYKWLVVAHGCWVFWNRMTFTSMYNVGLQPYNTRVHSGKEREIGAF